MEIGSTLKRLRKEAGLKQCELAELIGISQGYMCDIEQDRRPLPKRYLELLPSPLRQEFAAWLIKQLEREIVAVRKVG